jgi:hypothetical protein
MEGHDNIIYLSGHETSQQFIRKNNVPYVISGSGDRASKVTKSKNLDFKSDQPGYSKVLITKNGALELKFIGLENNDPKVLFSKELAKSPAKPKEVQIQDIDYGDSTITVIGGANYTAGKLKRLFWGNHYREAWLTPVQVPLISMSKEHGGMLPVKLGGGFQTKSMRLQSKEGGQFVFRSIQKYPKKILPEELRNTWMGDVYQDQISMAHPYGAFVIPTLAEAAQIHHKKPKLVYVPDDPRLGKYRDIYKNTLALYEERASKNLSGYANFGYAEKGIGTPDLLKKMKKNHKHLADEREVLKNRLFDMWVGDWDRHDDQWRWAEFDCNKPDHSACFHEIGEKGTGKVYHPIPRDRDQVFVSLDGILPWIVRRRWAAPMLVHFDHNLKKVEGINIHGRPLDITFLSRLTKDQWIEEAKALQSRLTDSVISKAIAEWPKPIFEIDGADIISKLKSRRNELLDYAEQYYEVLAKEVEITGSNKKETFEVERKKDGHTQITVYRKGHKKKEGSILYQRDFDYKETKEIRLYGFGGNDHFKLSGESDKGTLIRIIGGEGKDKVIDQSKVKGIRKLTQIYDRPNSIEIDGSKETKDLTNEDPDVNSYTRNKFKADNVLPLVKLGFNIDDGVFIGGGFLSTEHGWRKTPYKIDHKLQGAIAAKTGAFAFEYKSNFYQLIKNWNLNLDLNVLAPNSITNYYGLGNETKKVSVNPNYHLVKFNNITFQPSLSKHIGEFHQLKFGSNFEYFEVEKTANRFIATDVLTDEAFEATTFIGVNLKYTFDNLKNKTLPQQGVRWNIQAKGLQNLNNSELINRIQSNISLFYTLSTRLKTTIATRFGASTILGDFQFYQANTLGSQNALFGQDNLRGYRRDRFSGRSAIYNNTELRIKLFNFRSYLFPGQFGVLSFIDHGKVFIDNEKSNKWHQSYGGGLWISPMDQVVITGIYSESDEEKIFALNLNFLF